MFPDNPTGIGVATVFKWMAIFFCAIQLWSGVSAITTQKAWVSRTEVVHGPQASSYGWNCIWWGLGSAAIAFGIWFFFERDSD
jgi:hypothetical protein